MPEPVVDSPAFVVWITGLPGAGKSTLAGALVRALAALGQDAVLLESDALRRVYTPVPTWDDAERERLYGTVARLAARVAGAGVPVVVDATGARRAWRDGLRAAVERFVEVWVDTPVDVCATRDPKGLYRAARDGRAPRLPGVGVPYEAPLAAEVVVCGVGDDPEAEAARVLACLEDRGMLRRRHGGVTISAP